MTLHLHRAIRSDRLASGLAQVLSTPLPDPFATEIVSVPTRGVERWLAQTLSATLGRGAEDRTDGVCAGIDFGAPEAMIGEALAGITGVEPGTDPWAPRQAVWPLLGVIDRSRGEAWADPLWRYLDRGELDDPSGPAGGSGGRRYATAHRLAELFDGYAAGRPQMIDRWLAGADHDAQAQPLPAALAWQAELYRRLADDLGSPGPAERLRTACRTLIEDPDSSPLPTRLSVFGATRLPYATLAVLSALARHRQVHLWLPHASPALWRTVAGRLDDPTARPAHPDSAGTSTVDGDLLPVPFGSRSADRTADLPRHRLLSYLGRDARELQLGLAGLPVDREDHPLDDDLQATAPGSPGRSLLQILHDDLAADRPYPAPADRPVITADDDSVAVHSAHGPDRQVEVLRELILGLLADDPQLEPRDIIVMCPDIETFAPLIAAAFGSRSALDQDDPAPAGHPGHQLRVRLADRSLRQLNPLLQVLGSLFDLAESRVGASQITDLCAAAPVATRFGFTDDDQLRIRDLVSSSGVRWGFDAQDRSRYAMGGFGQNTWAAGLDRMLLGVAMDEEDQQFLGTTLPMDDIDAGDVDLVGRLAELISRLQSISTALSGPQPLSDWMQACRAGLESITAVAPTDSWQLGQAYGELARIADSAAGRDDIALTRADARAVLADLFAGRPSRANFRTGTLTVATLMPMRSVPHKVVCLLGLDDKVFPRAGRLDGDDLLAADPWVGDRDRRGEDRQLLLDAIMAADDHLVIIYSGADPRTNDELPPSVPLGELLDTLDQSAVTADGGPVSAQLVHRHPLQPFDPRNFTADSAAPFSFDPDALAGARASTRIRTPPDPVFDDTPLPPYAVPAVIELADLVRFFDHPVRAFLRKRAGLSLYAEDEPEADDIPVELDGLGAWAIGDRLLSRRLESGIDLEHLVQAEWRRGEIPPRALGSRLLDPVVRKVAEIAERAQPLMPGDPRTVDVSAEVELPAGDGTVRHTVVGTVPGVYGDQVVSAQYSKLRPKFRLRSWIRLVALTATDPRPWQASTLAPPSAWEPGRSTLGPVTATLARLVLADLVDLYRTGMAEPLALPPATAAEYARIRQQDKSVRTLQPQLQRCWESDRDEVYAQVLGPLSIGDLLDRPSVSAEERGSLAEPSRFGSLARRVWHPLLLSEEAGRS